MTRGGGVTVSGRPPDAVAGRDAIVALFAKTFTASEGAEEGALIGGLAEAVLATPAEDLLVVTASVAGTLIGCICFTRMGFAQDTRSVWLLSPVAVAPDAQGMGVGQALVRHGLDDLRGRGVDVALTYGDPDFYGKVGFRHVTADTVPPPHPLTQPEGWLAQSLSGAALAPFRGPSTCVAALDRSDFW